MTNTTKGLEFDPGFAPFILAFRGTVEYLYIDINKFKNLSQKKTRFRQYYKKILEVFDNNLGFYVGCLMWAAYIKIQPKQEILSNHCFGQKYDEAENISDTQFMLNFTNLYPKDMKYFLAQDYKFDEKIIQLIKVYEEFLVLNEGFTKTKYNSDIILPEAINTDNADVYKETINTVLETGNLAKLLEQIPTILR